MSKASDKRNTFQEIAYLRKCISGLKNAESSAQARAATIDAEILALQEKRARILSDAILAPTLLARARARLETLEALDFLSGVSRPTKEQTLRRKMLTLKLELETLAKELERFSS